MRALLPPDALPISGTRFLSGLCLALLAALLLAAQTGDPALPLKQIAKGSDPEQAASSTRAHSDSSRWQQAYSRLPLSFEASHGQAAAPVKFLARGDGYRIFLTATEAVLTLRNAGGEPATLRLGLSGANAKPEISGCEQLPGRSSYFIGSDPQQWRAGLPTYARVKYAAVYPGIDLVWYGRQRQLEYDFIVAPGADPDDIRLTIAGAEAIRLRQGELALKVAGGELLQHQPLAYQETDEGRQMVTARYVITAENQIGFELGAYDRSLPLVIDPVLSYSSFLGGSGSDQATSIAVDNNGNAFITGSTFSTDFPTAAPQQAAAAGQSDIFVLKLNTNAAGNAALVYLTFIGGREEDRGNGIAIDSSGNAYVTGATTSTNFPTVGAAQGAFGSSAVFKSTNGGGAWQPGGSGLGAGVVTALAIDRNNASILYAATAGSGVFKSTTGGGVWNAVNTGLTGTDVRALAFDPNNTSIIYAATAAGVFKSANGGGAWSAINGPLSGNGSLASLNVRALAVDPSNPNTLYAGTTTGVFKSVNGGAAWTAASSGLTSSNIVALVINPAASATLYAATSDGGVFKSTSSGASWSASSTGLGDLHVQALAIDPSNPNTLYAGTPGGVFKTVNGGASWSASSTGLTNQNVRALTTDPAAAATLYAATAGGIFKSTDSGANWSASNNGQTNTDIRALAVNPTGSATLYAGGSGASDAVLIKLSANGSALLYSTFLGGGAGDLGNSVAVDGQSKAYVTGVTASANFPLATAINSALGGSSDAFVARVDTTLTGSGSLTFSTYLGGSASDQGNGIAIDSSGNAYVTGATTSANFPTTDSAFSRTYGNNAVFKTTDSAANWNASSNPIPGDTVNALIIDQTNPATIFVGNGNGVFKSTDGGSTWMAKNSGLASTDVRALTIDPFNGSILYAGTTAGVFKSFDGGNTWQAASSGLTRLSVRALAVDPVNTSIIYAGISFGGVFKSSNGGNTWQPANSGLPGAVGQAGDSLANVLALAVDPKTPATIYASVSDAGVFKSVNGGAAWSASNAGLGSLNAQALAINPMTPATLYAGTVAGVFKSTNGGAAWSASNTGLTSLSVLALALDPTTPDTLYAGTAAGVFKSASGGANWSASSKGISASIVSALAVNPAMPATVYAGSGSPAGDAFVTKLSSSALLYSSFIGGGDGEAGLGIAVSSADTVFITGFSSSPGFPVTANAFDTSHNGSNDAFVMKLNTAATGAASVVYSTFLGGSASDQGNGIAVEAGDNVIITGVTASDNFPVVTAINPALNGATDGFVARLDPAAAGAAGVIFSSFLGGSSSDAGLGIAVDSAGTAYVAGVTASNNFPVGAGAFDGACGQSGECPGAGDAFIARITNSADVANLSVTRMLTSPFRPGQNGSYKLTVTNAGPTVARAPLRVIETLPAGLGFVSAAGAGWNCAASGQTVTCTNQNSLTAGGSTEINFVVSISSSAASGLEPSAVVTSATSDSDAANNRAGGPITLSLPCSFVLTVSGTQFVATGGSGTVQIAAASDCAWQAASNSPFITLGATTSGSGNGTVSFTLAENTSSLSRTGTLTVAGQTVTITQAGVPCNFVIAPDRTSFTSAGGTGMIEITAPAGCTWQAVTDNPALINLTGNRSGNGNGKISFLVSPNAAGTLRTGTITIAGQKITIIQSQTGCAFVLDPGSATFGARGGDSFVFVTATLDTCEWTVMSNAGFINVLSDRDQSGTVFVIYEVAPNTGAAARTGTLTIAGKTFTVTQAGASASVNRTSSTRSLAVPARPQVRTKGPPRRE
ncbi:MAG TPA: SBBP repeat-containing protein [Blastocatellia bacterium]|nr:SBBP repeat-containing protein [Blastocatellia bacterium]